MLDGKAKICASQIAGEIHFCRFDLDGKWESGTPDRYYFHVVRC